MVVFSTLAFSRVVFTKVTLRSVALRKVGKTTGTSLSTVLISSMGPSVMF